MRRILFAIASACAFAAFASPAAAAPETERFQERVSYADLDISTEDGAVTLLRRIDNAARNVCGRDYARLTLRGHREFRRCVARASDRAVARIGNPTLFAVHHERTGRSPSSIALALMDRS